MFSNERISGISTPLKNFANLPKSPEDIYCPLVSRKRKQRKETIRVDLKSKAKLKSRIKSTNKKSLNKTTHKESSKRGNHQSLASTVPQTYVKSNLNVKTFLKENTDELTRAKAASDQHVLTKFD